VRIRVPCADLILVAVAALAARLLVLVLIPGYVPLRDDRSYLDHAIALRDTGHYPLFRLAGGMVEPAAYRPPGWPAVIWLTWLVTGGGIGAARLLLAVLGTLTAVVVAVMGRRLFGRGPGLAAGLIAALCPPLVLIGASLESETLFGLLVSAAALAALLARDARGGPRLAWAVATGLLAGGGALTRSNGLAVVPLLGLLAMPPRPDGGGRAIVPRAAVAVATMLVALAVVAPWTARNARALHAFVPVSTETGNTLAGSFSAYSARHGARWFDPRHHGVYLDVMARFPDQVGVDRALTRASVNYALRHPAYPAMVLVRNTGRLTGLSGPGWSSYSLGTMSLPGAWAAPALWPGLLATVLAGLAGAVLVLRRRVGRPPWAWWAIPAVLLLSVALVNGEQRLVGPVLPFLCVLAGQAAASVTARSGSRSGPSARSAARSTRPGSSRCGPCT
jgi:4-amino-4-deoxy-L-arabinose transferase-like glycosyltransferase